MRPLLINPDHERAHDGSDDRTEASEQARAPKHGCGYDRKFITLAKLETTRSKASGVEHSGERCSETRDDQHLHLDIMRLDSGKLCRGFASAGRQDFASEGRLAKGDVANSRGNQSPN